VACRGEPSIPLGLPPPYAVRGEDKGMRRVVALAITAGIIRVMFMGVLFVVRLRFFEVRIALWPNSYMLHDVVTLDPMSEALPLVMCLQSVGTNDANHVNEPCKING
jgi:hypothetical protein